MIAGFFAAATAALLAGGLAFAQAGGGSSSDGRVLGGQEQIARAEQALASGRDAVARIERLLDESRRARDLIRMTCLNDKLAQFSAGLENLEGRVDGLRDAVESGDVGRANHEYTVTSVIAQKQETLSREVNQCVGQDLYETGDTSVEVSIVGELPGDDPTQVRAAEPYQIPLVPAPASPLF